MIRGKLFKVTTKIKVSTTQFLTVNVIAKTPLDAIYCVSDSKYDGKPIAQEQITSVVPLLNGEEVYCRYSYDNVDDFNPYYIAPEDKDNEQ